MSLFKSQSSFTTLTFVDSHSMDKIVETLKEYPFRNIVGEEDLSLVSYIPDLTGDHVDFVCNKRFLYLVERVQTKILPEARIKKEIEMFRLAEYAHIPKKDFKENYAPSIYRELCEKYSPSCSVKITETDFIIDFEKKIIYTSMKGSNQLNSSIYRLERNLDIVEPRIMSNITKELTVNAPWLNSEISNELFLYWLYQRSRSADREKLNIELNLKIKDKDSKLDIKGDIYRFEDIFVDLKEGRSIQELSMSLPNQDESTMDVYPALMKFSLNIKKDGVKNFKNPMRKYSKVYYSDLHPRVEDFEKVNLLIRRLFHKFQKEILSFGIEEMYNELRHYESED